MQQYVMGDDGQFYMVGADAPRVAPAGGAMLRLPPPPAWRPQIAPGVNMPQEGLDPLALDPLTADGVFDATTTFIQFEARPQRAFRGERILATIARNGATAAGAIPVASGGFFVGTQVVGASLGDIPLDNFSPTAFGVRLTFQEATPGMAIRVSVRLKGTALAGTDTLTVGLMVIGRVVR